MRILIVIPARGGSKGLPKKNIYPLDGQPLINYTISAAREVLPDSDICLSTDSEEIKTVVEQSTGLKVPFLRPDELSTDTSGTYEVLLNALEFYEQKGVQYDVLVLLQPTSPLRTGRQVKEAIQLFTESVDMVVSVKKTKSNPYFVLFEEDESGYLQQSKTGTFTRRQDCPDVWEYNGAIYVLNVQTLKKHPIHEFEKIKKYVMDAETSVDIDKLYDLKLAEFILQSKKEQG